MKERSIRSSSMLIIVLMILFSITCFATCSTSSMNDDEPLVTIRSVKPTTIIIHGGVIVTHDVEFRGTVVVRDGKVVNLLNHDQSFDHILKEEQKEDRIVKVLDATDRYVMPGGIDPHVHLALKFMGTISRDDFYHGTRAALSGGTTMIMDFAIPGKGESYLDIVNEYKRRGEKLACADYSFHVGITGFNENTAKEMKELVENHGINSFKFFMAYKGVFQVNDEELYNGFKTAMSIGAISQVHAENGDLVVQGQTRLFNDFNITGPEGHPQSRPSNVEAEAVRRASEIAYSVGNAPLYIVHVMSKEAMDEIAHAKAKGYRIVGEPIAAGLTLDDSVYYKGSWMDRARFVMSPPIRGVSDQKALVAGLKNRILDLTGTDHCTFNSEQKKMGLGDFRKIPNGINGLEDRMSLLFDRLVATGEMSPSDYVRITSTEAAQIFNIYPQKGAIQIGSDADIIILNPNATRIISAKTHHQNIDYNVYEGREVRGVVEVTISNGQVVWENGQLNVEGGSGRFIPNKPFGKMFRGLQREQETHAPIKVQ